MPRLEMMWLEIKSDGKSAIFGLSTVEKRPQISLNDARRVFEGSIEGFWIKEPISGGPRNASHIGGRPKLGSPTTLVKGSGIHGT